MAWFRSVTGLLLWIVVAAPVTVGRLTDPAQELAFPKVVAMLDQRLAASHLPADEAARFHENLEKALQDDKLLADPAHRASIGADDRHLLQRALEDRAKVAKEMEGELSKDQAETDRAMRDAVAHHTLYRPIKPNDWRVQGSPIQYPPPPATTSGSTRAGAATHMPRGKVVYDLPTHHSLIKGRAGIDDFDPAKAATAAAQHAPAASGTVAPHTVPEKQQTHNVKNKKGRAGLHPHGSKGAHKQVHRKGKAKAKTAGAAKADTNAFEKLLGTHWHKEEQSNPHAGWREHTSMRERMHTLMDTQRIVHGINKHQSAAKALQHGHPLGHEPPLQQHPHDPHHRHAPTPSKHAHAVTRTAAKGPHHQNTQTHTQKQTHQPKAKRPGVHSKAMARAGSVSISGGHALHKHAPVSKHTAALHHTASAHHSTGAAAAAHSRSAAAHHGHHAPGSRKIHPPMLLPAQRRHLQGKSDGGPSRRTKKHSPKAGGHTHHADTHTSAQTIDQLMSQVDKAWHIPNQQHAPGQQKGRHPAVANRYHGVPNVPSSHVQHARRARP